MRVFDAPVDQKRRPRRPLRGRQDPACERHVVRRRRRQSPRQGGRGHDGHRLRRGGNRAQAHARVEPRLARMEQDEGQPRRYAGHRELPERHARRHACHRCRTRRGRRGRRRPGTDRGGLAGRAGIEPAPAHRLQPLRSRTRQPRAIARVAARHVRPHRGTDHDSDRPGARLPRRHRSGRDEGADVQDGRERRDDRGRHPFGSGRRGAGRA